MARTKTIKVGEIELQVRCLTLAEVRRMRDENVLADEAALWALDQAGQAAVQNLDYHTWSELRGKIYDWTFGSAAAEGNSGRSSAD